MNKYINPDKNLSVFTCPHCGAISQMEYKNIRFQSDANFIPSHGNSCEYSITVARCVGCGGKIVWIDDRNVYPDIVNLHQVKTCLKQ